MLDQRLRKLNGELPRLLVASVVDYAIFALDPDGTVATWNPGAERIKGWRARDIVGKHFSAFYTPEDVAAGKPERELAVAARRGRVEDEGWRLRKDGSRFWAGVVISAVRDADGELIGFAKVTADLTRRVLSEEATRKVAVLEERERIAREVHASLVYDLFAIGLRLQAAASEVASPTAEAHINQAVDELDRMIQELRSHIFRPEPPDSG